LLPGAEALRRDPQGPILLAAGLRGITPEVRLFHEESFGPVTSMIKIRNHEEALETANSTDSMVGQAGWTALCGIRYIRNNITDKIGFRWKSNLSRSLTVKLRPMAAASF
jgi:hypothetical protein